MIDLMLNNWKAIIEIIILWFLFYRIVLFFEGTRAAYVFRGILILVITFFIFQRLGLNTLEWILTKIFAISVLGLIIIFQPELRHGLAQLGQPHVFTPILPEEDIKRVIQEISEAVMVLSKNKNGALIAIERENKLKTYKESGVFLNGEVRAELIQSIFAPNTPLHDGGVIIRGDKIICAACLFPLTDNPYLSRNFGTRHRAAIGLTENSDAVVIVVSESTGAISVAKEGVLSRNLDKEVLDKSLYDAFKIMRKVNEKQELANQ